MTADDQQGWSEDRVALALIGSAVVPSLLFGGYVVFTDLSQGGHLQPDLVMISAMMAGMMFLGAAPVALILGLPAYYLLRRRIQPKRGYAILAGVVTFIALPLVPAIAADGSYNQSFVDFLFQMSTLATAGGLSGLAFWRLLTGGFGAKPSP